MSILSYTVFISSPHCVLFWYSLLLCIVVLFQGIQFGVQAFAITFSLVSNFVVLWTLAVDSIHSSHSESNDLLQQRKMVLGSRPPGCENKCFNCRPCIATLVIPSHHRAKRFSLSSHADEDDSYYLLSWKCKCGQKLFQPWWSSFLIYSSSVPFRS